jgi:hypothetical protein
LSAAYVVGIGTIVPQLIAPTIRLLPKEPKVLAELFKEHVVLYATLDPNTFTDDPAAAVIPLVLKLASLLEIAICAVAAEALIPSELAFSAVE